MRPLDRGPNDGITRLDAALEDFRFEWRKFLYPIVRPILDWLVERIGR